VSNSRSPQFPDLPTIAEAGYPKAAAVSWYALHAPAGVPAEVVRKLEAAMDAAVATPEVRDRLAVAGGEAAFLGQAAFKAFLKDDGEHWQEIVRLINP
jgi:tripartite-type tricarboxylate transporter receptor subunit TctC